MFVWFYLKEGQFIYDDMFFDAEEIQSLIKKNKLVFKCIASHQGEKMVKYVLNTKQC
jgi:saccharopine dehydrogenase-like NADP-dependent oxidoreductase